MLSVSRLVGRFVLSRRSPERHPLHEFTANASLVLAVLATTACSGSEPTKVCVVWDVTVSPSTATIAQGATTTLSAADAPGGCTPMPAATWTTSNERIATVNQVGVVTAVAPGIAVVTATIRTLSDSAVVTVTPP